MGYGGSSSVNWAASLIMFDPVRPSHGDWADDDEDGWDWQAPVDEGSDDDLDLLGVLPDVSVDGMADGDEWDAPPEGETDD